MLEHGKVYKWDDISNEYPNMYAIITDIKRHGGTIDTCRLLEIVPFENMEETAIRYLGHHIILPTPYLMQNYGT